MELCAPWPVFLNIELLYGEELLPALFSALLKAVEIMPGVEVEEELLLSALHSVGEHRLHLMVE